jgi:hypothetical protein
MDCLLSLLHQVGQEVNLLQGIAHSLLDSRPLCAHLGEEVENNLKQEPTDNHQLIGLSLCPEQHMFYVSMETRNNLLHICHK